MAWNDAVVTNAGVALLRQVLSGEKLTLDGAAGGTGTVSSASLMAQTALKDEKQTFSIVGMTNVDNGKKINLQVTNLDLETGYTLNQVGIWAHVGTGESVLYAILQDPTGITIPSKTEMKDFAMNLYAVIDFGNDVSVNLTIDATALVTRATLDEELNKKLDKGELGELAYKSKAEKTDLSDDVQSSLDKADTAVQAETDPTVPSWAKQPIKPSYTADEIGAIPSAEKGQPNGVASLDKNGTVFDRQLPAISITDTDVSVSPDVATALGLDSADNPQVKDGFLSISDNFINILKYCWSIQSISYTYSISTSGKNETLADSSSITSKDYLIGDSISIDRNKVISINNPSRITIKNKDNSDKTILHNKYFAKIATPHDVKFVLHEVSGYAGDINEAESPGLWPKSYYSYVYAFPINLHKRYSSDDEIYDRDRNKYPNPGGLVGEKYYSFLGNSEFLKSFRILKGSYIGTGTSGKGYPNVLRIPNAYKLLVIISPKDIIIANISAVSYEGYATVPILGDSTSIEFKRTENNLGWYAGSSSSQYNLTNEKYNYIAIYW